MTIKPNIILIMNDDMGFSDLGCYGGEVDTPNLDALASSGMRFTQFYNTARCCPSRASILTGLYPHQADIGHMMDDDGVDGYVGDLSFNAVTIAEALKPSGYRNYMSGKWHVTRFLKDYKHNWPNQRGFDDFYGMITGASNFYYPRTLVRNNEEIEAGENFYFTDAITDEAIRQLEEHDESYSDKPFFQYIAYTAPHWPLHALPEDIEKYHGRFDKGWDRLREERMERMADMGLIDEGYKLTDRDPSQPPWEEADNKAWQARRMEVYAAQIDRMDQGIGRIMDRIKDLDKWDNTIILFLADNGGCAEELDETFTMLMEREDFARREAQIGEKIHFGNNPHVMPGPENTYQSYGVPWANLSNTPFRLYKHWVHEGGISTPFIVHWPGKIKDEGSISHKLGQLPDIMATILDITGTDYPKEHDGHEILPLEGYSMAPFFEGKDNNREYLYWEHEGNRAIRKDNFKLVSKYPMDWELYDMDKDRTEMNDLSEVYPDKAEELSSFYDEWAERCNVMPWDELLKLREERNK